MGGRGSGNWQPRLKKSTVEESLDVGMRDFRQVIWSRSDGTFEMTWASGFFEHSITLSLAWDGSCPSINLFYGCENEDICIPVRLQTTPTNFNGNRWWLTCPLIVGGVPCGRRVGKLYLPPGERYF